MPLSHRITHLTGGGSDGWDVFYRARAMIAAGVNVTELTIGEHDIGTERAILDAMHKAALGGHTGYASVPGTEDLRRIVAARVQARTGVATSPENVLITPGGQAALFATHMAVCDPGDVALYIDPYYATYPGTIRGVGAKPRAVQARASNGFQPRVADIEAAAEGPRSLLINTPNNPTGVVYSRQTLEDICRFCQRRGIWLISDEVYDTQVWQGTHISPRSLPGMENCTLVIGSMSKSHAMTGSRCGWIVGPEEVIGHLINLATHTTYGVPGFIQDAAAFALAQGHELEQAIAAPFLTRRNLALNLLGAQNVVKAVPADGAMYLMLDIRATGLSGESFANALLDSQHIAVMPGESFGLAAAGHVRVAMTIDDGEFETAMGKLCQYATDLADTRFSVSDAK